MKFRHSLFFLIIGIVLISAGIFTQMVSVVSAHSSQQEAEPSPVVPPFTDTACLECHTNQETLKTLAVEEVVVESISEGPG